MDVDFRKKAMTSARDCTRVEAAVLSHVEQYLTIEEILELDSAVWDAPFEPAKLSSIAEGGNLAIRVRSQ